MLYLVEVKRQSKGFIGGSKTELKLLACQHNDQTWSAIPTDDVISWEDSQMQVGEGTLLLVNLSTSRQIQGKPELAGGELVRQLQKMSRRMEKIKEEQESIEQWKQSLTYQAEQLAKREIELDSRQEQIEQMETEFEYLERQRHELEEAREQLKKEQEQLENTKDQYRLPSNSDGSNPEQQLTLALETLSNQQGQFNNYWQQLEQKQVIIEQRQQEINQHQENFQRSKQELAQAKAELEEAKIQLALQQNLLTNKQELLGRINLNLQTIESLQSTLSRISDGTEDSSTDNKLNLQVIENMPLGELEECVNKLRADLDKLVRFVNEQEEELTLQCQSVEELNAKLEKASDFERLSIEEELKDEQERKKMLDETLVGQRRTLWERQEILLHHLRVLRRRQGILEPEQQGNQIDITPLLNQLQNQQVDATKEQQKLAEEIDNLHNNLQHLQGVINQKIAEQENKERELEQHQEQWQQAKVELTTLQFELKIYEEMFKPFKDNLNRIDQKLQEVKGWFSS